MELLLACLAKLVERHEVLRTTFLEVATYPDWVETARAIISPTGHVALEVVDRRRRRTKRRRRRDWRLSIGYGHSRSGAVRCGGAWR